MSPGQWIDYVESKKYDDISVVQSVDGEIRFLTQLSAESQVWQLHDWQEKKERKKLETKMITSITGEQTPGCKIGAVA